MTQIQFTLEDELVKELFLDPNQEAMKKLMEKIIDAILNAEAEGQVAIRVRMFHMKQFSLRPENTWGFGCFI